MMVTKNCTRCGKAKPLSEFYKHRLSKDGHAFQCKVCNRVRARVYAKTPAGIHSRLRARTLHYKTKPFNLGRAEFIKWYDDREKRCVYCGIRADDLPKLSDPFNDVSHRLTVDCMDNEVGYVVENLVLACERCNTIKGNMFSHEQMLEIGARYVRPIWER